MPIHACNFAKHAYYYTSEAYSQMVALITWSTQINII